MKKKISILILCFFMMTIFAGGAVAKNDNSNKGNNKIKSDSVYNRGQQAKFIDIDSDWAKDEIDKVAQKGYMKGYGDGKFQPNKPITCLEAIVALMSTLEQEGEITLDDVDVDSNNSLLKKIPDWGKVYVTAALDEGILLESEMKNFNPNQGIKRYQVAIYFTRMTESGYGEYIEDYIGEEEWDFDLDLDSILQDIDEALEDLDVIIEEEDAEELNIDEFISMLEKLQVNLEDLDEADIDQDVIDEAVEDVDLLISELKDIIEDAEDEEFDDIVEALDEVLEILKGIKSDLKTFTKTKDVGYFFNFNDEDQIPFAAKQSVKSMQKLRIMFGDTDGKFSPMRVVKRNELAAMLNRLDDNYFCQKDYELITGILDDIEYDTDEEIFTLFIIDEDGDAVDEIDFTDEDRLYFNGKLLDFDEEIDEEKYAAIENIKTGGKIKVCINNQDELVWARIYSPEKD